MDHRVDPWARLRLRDHWPGAWSDHWDGVVLGFFWSVGDPLGLGEVDRIGVEQVGWQGPLTWVGRPG